MERLPPIITNPTAASTWDTVVSTLLNVKTERKSELRTTDRIFELVAASTEPMTLKQLQDQLELSPGIVSGSLASLCKSGRLCREKMEKTNGTGPKMQWTYKIKKDE